MRRSPVASQLSQRFCLTIFCPNTDVCSVLNTDKMKQRNSVRKIEQTETHLQYIMTSIIGLRIVEPIYSFVKEAIFFYIGCFSKMLNDFF